MLKCDSLGTAFNAGRHAGGVKEGTPKLTRPAHVQR